MRLVLEQNAHQTTPDHTRPHPTTSDHTRLHPSTPQHTQPTQPYPVFLLSSRDSLTEQRDNPDEVHQQVIEDTEEDQGAVLWQNFNAIEVAQQEREQQAVRMQTANLAYIDSTKRTVSCRLCVGTQRTVHKMFLEAHLRNKHNMPKKQ